MSNKVEIVNKEVTLYDIVVFTVSHNARQQGDICPYP
jgi:hypothetical protein